VYSQKLNVEQGILTTTREAMKVVQEKKDVEAKMAKIKAAIRALSPTFPELIVQPDDTAEVAARHVPDLI